MSLALATPAEAQRARTPATLASCVIIGLDDRGKPHASRFPAAALAEVEAAADLMGMSVLEVESEALASLTEQLPVGRLFPSGKGFVPFVGQDLYRQLEAYLPIAKRRRLVATGTGDPKAADGSTPADPPPADPNAYAKAKASGKPRSGKHPEDWDKIAVGHIVLASEGRDDGWWTAHVREVRADGSYLLEWEEFVGYDRFVCRRDKIALLHPDYDGK